MKNIKINFLNFAEIHQGDDGVFLLRGITVTRTVGLYADPSSGDMDMLFAGEEYSEAILNFKRWELRIKTEEKGDFVIDLDDLGLVISSMGD
jgi:hypothetical protein